MIVDADIGLRATLVAQLSLKQEFQVAEAGTVGEAEARLLAPNQRCDAVLLEIGLPDGDGRDLCIKLRKLGLRMPIIMLTGADAEDDIVRGLEAGANDFIAKPIRLNELVARLRAQLRMFDHSEYAVFTIGPYTFRPSAKILLDSTHNRKIRLTEKEVAILKFLYRANGRIVSRPELLNEVWGYTPRITTHTLETHIYRLRQKVEPDPTSVRMLLTERGGYRLDPSPAIDALVKRRSVENVGCVDLA